jgi:hypothetical protein
MPGCTGFWGRRPREKLLYSIQYTGPIDGCWPTATWHFEYPQVALRGPTYRENSHANHTWHPKSHQTACFKDAEALAVWVRFPSPAPLLRQCDATQGAPDDRQLSGSQTMWLVIPRPCSPGIGALATTPVTPLLSPQPRRLSAGPREAVSESADAFRPAHLARCAVMRTPSSRGYVPVNALKDTQLIGGLIHRNCRRRIRSYEDTPCAVAHIAVLVIKRDSVYYSGVGSIHLIPGQGQAGIDDLLATE